MWMVLITKVYELEHSQYMIIMIIYDNNQCIKFVNFMKAFLKVGYVVQCISSIALQ